MNVLSEILSKSFCRRTVDHEPPPFKGCNLVDCDYCKIKKNVPQYCDVKDVEKVLKADQEKLKPLMAHLQNFPSKHGLDAVDYCIKISEWEEELDKRTATPENYVCIERKKLSELMSFLKERREDIKIDFEDFGKLQGIEELLQPSTTESS